MYGAGPIRAGLARASAPTSRRGPAASFLWRCAGRSHLCPAPATTDGSRCQDRPETGKRTSACGASTGTACGAPSSRHIRTSTVGPGSGRVGRATSGARAAVRRNDAGAPTNGSAGRIHSRKAEGLSSECIGKAPSWCRSRGRLNHAARPFRCPNYTASGAGDGRIYHDRFAVEADVRHDSGCVRGRTSGSPVSLEADALCDAASPYGRLYLGHSKAENQHDTVGLLIDPTMHNNLALRPRGYPEEQTWTDANGDVHRSKNGFAVFESYAACLAAWRRRLVDTSIDTGKTPKNYVEAVTMTEYCEVYNPLGDKHPVTGLENKPERYCNQLLATINRLPLDTEDAMPTIYDLANDDHAAFWGLTTTERNRLLAKCIRNRNGNIPRVIVLHIQQGNTRTRSTGTRTTSARAPRSTPTRTAAWSTASGRRTAPGRTATSRTRPRRASGSSPPTARTPTPTA